VRRFIALLVVLGFMLLMQIDYPAAMIYPWARTTFSFGFLLLAAYLLGDVLAGFKMPKITGYILAGIVFGPYVLNLVPLESVRDLGLIDDLALTFIALAAGGELRLKELKNRKRVILLTVAFLTLIVFGGVTLFMILARPLMPFLDGKPFIHVVAVAAIVGTFAVARSPSSAIAIISETKARGPFTEMVLGVTVLMDVGVIAFFAVVVTLCQAAVSTTGGMDFNLIITMTLEIVLSIGAGLGLGWLMMLYIKHVKVELMIFIIGVAFLTTFGSKQFAVLMHDQFGMAFHLHAMLICITAGFLIQNYSPSGRVFMEKIDHASLPIYVIFFAHVGADLDIRTLEATWLIAVLIVTMRCLLIWLGGYVGGKIAGDPPVMRRWSGPSFITQAGVSLGLAGIVKVRFPEWGAAVATMIVAVITLNQVIGPVTFKLALGAVGETRESRQAEVASKREKNP
jgi:Kef-type K+ transport system membrane component KefB